MSLDFSRMPEELKRNQVALLENVTKSLQTMTIHRISIK